MKGIAALWLTALILAPSAAQEVTVLPEGTEVVRGLTRATSVRIDPAGVLYIADPGRHVIDVRHADGTQVHVLGGPGAGQGQFDGPMDVDPTTGLLIVVADAGNSRLSRFRARFELAETVPLYGSSREVLDLSVSTFEQTGQGEDRTPGRPISVVLSEANETFAIDEVRGVVAKWDIGRRLVAMIGDETGPVQLREPVDLEIIEDQLYVADRALSSVVVFDLFGGLVTEYGAGRLIDLAGLSSWSGELWVLHGERVSMYSQGGVLEATLELPESVEGPVDVALDAESLYVLTPNRMFMWPLGMVRKLLR
jgi:hypothetical protein